MPRYRRSYLGWRTIAGDMQRERGALGRTKEIMRLNLMTNAIVTERSLHAIMMSL